jgi:hypothetical protein
VVMAVIGVVGRKNQVVIGKTGNEVGLAGLGGAVKVGTGTADIGEAAVGVACRLCWGGRGCHRHG